MQNQRTTLTECRFGSTHCSVTHSRHARLQYQRASQRLFPRFATKNSTYSSKRGRTIAPPQAIGFDLPGSTPSVSAEKQAEQLLKTATSLLLYQSALTGKPAKAFLRVLNNIQRGEPLEPYGDLYRSLAADGHASWQDYLLDQILRCTDSPFVQMASKAESTAHLHAAVSHDLDALQQLAVADATLASWVQFQSGASDSWLKAASSLHSKSATTNNNTAFGFSAAVEDDVADFLPAEMPAFVKAPLSKEQRLTVCSEIARQWKWSEAVPLLERYHQNFDRGIVSLHSILKWTGSSFQAQDVLKGVAATQDAPTMKKAEAVAKVVESFLEQDISNTANMPPHTVVLDKEVVEAYKAVIAALTQKKISSSGLRTVLLPANKCSTLPELAWSMSQHPRVKFIVICPWMSSTGPNDFDTSEVPLVLANDGFSWPSNALFVGLMAKLPAQHTFQHVVELN